MPLNGKDLRNELTGFLQDVAALRGYDTDNLLMEGFKSLVERYVPKALERGDEEFMGTIRDYGRTIFREEGFDAYLDTVIKEEQMRLDNPGASSLT